MPLNTRLRAWLYAAFAALFLSGAGWLVADFLQGAPGAGDERELASLLLTVHGSLAMPTLMLLGALFPLHVQGSWRRGKNLGSGVTMLAVNGVLIVTALGLYYIGAEALRRWTSDIHIAVGLAFPVLITIHVVLGKRNSLRRSLDVIVRDR